MPLPISVNNICVALETASEKLASPGREQVRTVLASTSSESRALLFFPIQMHAPVEVWHGSVYAPDADSTVESEHACREVLKPVGSVIPQPVGWLCLLARSNSACGGRSLMELVHNFHFFAPLRCLSALKHLQLSFAQQVRALQRLRPAVNAELFGDEIAFAPPAAFGAADPDVVLLNAMSPLEALPEQCCRYPFDPLSATLGSVLVLYGTATKIEPDPAMGLARKGWHAAGRGLAL